MQFIVVFVVKVLKLKEVNDVREYEDEDGNRSAAGNKSAAGNRAAVGNKAAAGLLRKPKVENNGDDDAGHHISAQG